MAQARLFSSRPSGRIVFPSVDAVIDRARPAGRVVVRAEVADGLVHHPVDGLLGLHGLVVHRDLVRGGASVRGWDPDLHGDLSEIPIAARPRD